MSMTTMRRLRRTGAAALLAAGAMLLAACGGGSDPVADEAAASYSEGPIEGLGSVIVGGVRYDDSTAIVEDEDGNSAARSELQLGVTVEIDASHVRNLVARALRIRFGAEIVGPVSKVDAGASTLVVLGQTVEVNDTTVFSKDLPATLAEIQVGTVLAVHALYVEESGHYIATRLDARPNAPVYRLRGPVSDLDKNAKTFRIGPELISYANIAPAELPSELANGLRVRVRLDRIQVNGTWIALSVRHGLRRIDDRGFVHLHGIVSAFTSSARFEVNGIPVDASDASFPDGTAGLGLSARVHIDGRIDNGVIIARKVELHDHANHHAYRFELHGEIGELDGNAKTFTLRGQTIHYALAAIVPPGSVIENGSKVVVKGFLLPDRRTLVAVIMRLEG